MFLLLICFFFLPATACDESATACEKFEGRQRYINLLENTMASKVHMTPGKMYRVFYGNDIEYRVQFKENKPECSLIHRDSSSERSLTANWSLPIMERAWLSHITHVLCGSDIASKISNIGNNPDDFTTPLGNGFELQAVMRQGRKKCRVVLAHKKEWFPLDAKLYDSVKQRFNEKEGQGGHLFAVLGSG